MKPGTIECPDCKGAGVVPRTQRVMADGKPDALDIVGRFKKVCDRCGGTGVIPQGSAKPNEKKPGHLADIGG